MCFFQEALKITVGALKSVSISITRQQWIKNVKILDIFALKKNLQTQSLIFFHSIYYKLNCIWGIPKNH